MINKKLPDQRKIFVISSSLSFICYGIVYLSGGTSFAFPHLFYLPIIIAAQFGTWKITLFTSILSSILMSYWAMPLHILMDILQSHFAWIFRSVMFIWISIGVKISTNKIREKNATILKKTENLSAVQQAAFIGMLDLAETRDLETTGNHLERLGYYAEALLRDMNIPLKLKENIKTYIPFHDIGKVAIPDSILLKPGNLTAEEFETIKEHTLIGGRIMEDIERH